MDIGDNEPNDVQVRPVNANDQGQVQNVGGPNNGWPEQADQPEAFPDVGFPINPPVYPTPPEFEYRYPHGPDSTPQRRRVDFQNSIVLRTCKRDPYTNRIPQEEYEAREEAEMMISLGYYILFNFTVQNIQYLLSVLEIQ